MDGTKKGPTDDATKHMKSLIMFLKCYTTMTKQMANMIDSVLSVARVEASISFNEGGMGLKRLVFNYALNSVWFFLTINKLIEDWKITRGYHDEEKKKVFCS